MSRKDKIVRECSEAIERAKREAAAIIFMSSKGFRVAASGYGEVSRVWPEYDMRLTDAQAKKWNALFKGVCLTGKVDLNGERRTVIVRGTEIK